MGPRYRTSVGQILLCAANMAARIGVIATPTGEVVPPKRCAARRRVSTLHACSARLLHRREHAFAAPPIVCGSDAR